MTAAIDRRTLFNVNIPEPEGLSELLHQLFPLEAGNLFPHKNFALNERTPPIFLYTESRGKDNWLQSFSYFGGNGQAAQVSMGAREVLQLNSKMISEAERGKILNSFCRIEFCLDVMVCLVEGVFEDRTQWAVLKGEFQEGSKYATTQRKIKELRQVSLIRDVTKRQLVKAKEIRNVLAHQFMPEAGLGLSDTDVRRYDSIPAAIEVIFNSAWIELLKDFAPRQVPIAKWLATYASIDLQGNID